MGDGSVLTTVLQFLAWPQPSGHDGLGLLSSPRGNEAAAAASFPLGLNGL